MSTCINECSLPTGENDLKILLCQLQREVETLLQTNEAKLLKQNGKIAELCNYLKDNLSNSIRCLLADMKNSGELDQLITETILCSLNKRVIFIDKAIKIKDSILQLGDVIQTLGYHEANDGGKALYKIREINPEDVEDKGFIHFTKNGYVAELIIDNKLNVKQFGAKGDNSSNDTIYFQKAMEYLVNNKLKTLYIPAGTYIIDGLGLKNGINIKGDGRIKTILKTSENTKDHFLYIDDSPIYHVNYEGFGLSNDKENVIGLDLTAIEQNGLNYTGGIWYSNFKDINISGFKIGINSVAEDIRGDVANQFLHFDNVNITRPGKSDDICLNVKGQFQHVMFTNCYFFGQHGKISKGKNVVLHSSTLDGGSSDSVSAIKFINCTIQYSEYGIELIGNSRMLFSVDISNCWFETLSHSIKLDTNSKVKVDCNYFGNAGHNETNEGYILYLGTQCSVSFINNYVAGSVDKLIIGNGSHYNLINHGNNVSPSYNSKGVTKQTSVDENGKLTINSNVLTFVSSLYPLSTIETKNKMVSNELKIYAWGTKPLVISNKGNIEIEKEIVLHRTDCIVLEFQDLTNKWIVKSLSKKELKSEHSPSTPYSEYSTWGFKKGEIMFKSNVAAGGVIGWICVEEGTPGTWKTFGSISE